MQHMTLHKTLGFFTNTQNTRTSFTRAALSALAGCALLAGGCEVFDEPSGGGSVAVSAERSALLADLARHVYRPTHQEALEQLEPLERALEGWSGALSGPELEAAREAWRVLALTTQRAELMQVGPAGVSGLRLGGEDLRDLTYSYPLSNPCRVDQELLSGRFTESTWALSAPINAKGLDALERLLFAEDTTNVCSEVSAMNRDGAWSAWVEQEGAFEEARRALALAISADLRTQLTTLTSRWAEGGEASVALSEGAAPFSSKREALDEVYASLFYLDQVSKDLKLALPLGLSPDCESEGESEGESGRCLEAVEHNASGLSREALSANLEGLLWVWLGGAPSDREARAGFDDLLRAEGASTLADDVTTRIEALINTLNAREGSLSALISEDIAWVEGVYEDLRALATLLKSDLPVVLNLSVPMEGAGDND